MGDALAKLSRSRYRLRVTSWAAVRQGTNINPMLVRYVKQVSSNSLYLNAKDAKKSPSSRADLRTAYSLLTCHYYANVYLFQVSANKTVSQ